MGDWPNRDMAKGCGRILSEAGKAQVQPCSCGIDELVFVVILLAQRRIANHLGRDLDTLDISGLKVQLLENSTNSQTRATRKIHEIFM